MKMIFSAFSKKLFGVKYERLTRTVFICLIVFWGLYTGGFRIPVAPFILYLMVSTFTAGVMWQALSSEDNAVNMQNMIMLPFERHKRNSCDRCHVLSEKVLVYGNVLDCRCTCSHLFGVG